MPGNRCPSGGLVLAFVLTTAGPDARLNAELAEHAEKFLGSSSLRAPRSLR